MAALATRTGVTTRSTGAAHLIVIAQPRISMGAPRAVTLPPIANLAPGNKLTASLAAPGAALTPQAARLTDLVDLRVVVAVAEALLAAVGVIAGPVLALQVAVDPPVWEAGVWAVVAEVAAADEIASAIRSRRETREIKTCKPKLFSATSDNRRVSVPSFDSATRGSAINTEPCASGERWCPELR